MEKKKIQLKDLKFDTIVAHQNHPPEEQHGGVNPPLQLSSIYAKRTPETAYGNYDSTRYGNPTMDALNNLISALEKGEYTWTLPSGCGAITTVLSLFSPGDHIVTVKGVYGGMELIAQKMFGKTHSFILDVIDMKDIEIVKANVKKDTKLVWLENPTNPLLEIIDLEGIIKYIKAFNSEIIVVVDNSVPSPYNQTPLELGADISMNSLSKYISGHSTVMGGSLTTRNLKLFEDLKEYSMRFGNNMSPFDAFMVLKGSKTLSLRMERIQNNAQKLSEFLESHPNVDRVSYPGLKSHPQHELAKKQMRKGYSGLIAFWIKGGKEQAMKFCNNLKLITIASSFGGTTSLVRYVYLTNHTGESDEERAKIGIDDRLIRISCGIEDPEDLIDDVKQALE